MILDLFTYIYMQSYVYTLYTVNLFICTFSNSEDPDEMPQIVAFHQGSHHLLKQSSETEMRHNLEIWTCDAFNI